MLSVNSLYETYIETLVQKISLKAISCITMHTPPPHSPHRTTWKHLIKLWFDAYYNYGGFAHSSNTSLFMIVFSFLHDSLFFQELYIAMFLYLIHLLCSYSNTSIRFPNKRSSEALEDTAWEPLSPCCSCKCACPSVSWCSWEGQRTTFGSQLSPSTMWVLGIELRFSGTAARTFTHSAIVLIPFFLTSSVLLFGPSDYVPRYQWTPEIVDGTKPTISSVFSLYVHIQEKN